MSADLRQRLLQVAPALAERLKLSEVTPLVVAAAAGVAERDFHALFESFEHYLMDVQQAFMERIRLRLIAETQSVTGCERMLRGGAIMLDTCLAEHKLRSWFMQARTQTLAVREGLQRQNNTYLLILSPDFEQAGWPHPRAAARLFLALLQEIALIEHAAHAPSADARLVMTEFLGMYR